MDFSLPLKAFLQQYFDAKTLNGAEKFLALCALLANGSNNELTPEQVKRAWSKTVLKVSYNPSQKHRAHAEGWVSYLGKRRLFVTEQGYEYLNSIQTTYSPIVKAGGITKLNIFTAGKTHNFDKFLRSVFSATTKEVLIADSFVDETIFDNLLDQIPENVIIHLVYGYKQGAFDARVKRFKQQYPHFSVKSHTALHDRFLVIDDVGYIVGPSLKDAARKSPATVVSLGQADTQKLKQFFMNFWSAS